MERLRVVVAWIVVGLWVFSIIAASVFRSFRPQPSLQAVMLMVAGYLFGPSIISRKRK